MPPVNDGGLEQEVADTSGTMLRAEAVSRERLMKSLRDRLL